MKPELLFGERRLVAQFRGDLGGGFIVFCFSLKGGFSLANFASAQSGETDSRLHADGPQGWGVREAKVKNPNLPRVLLIGDCILNGYLATVVHELEGKANVDA